MLVGRLIKFFTSLRLTVVLLAFAIVLLFLGTLAQADEGLYNAQARYFRQWIVLGLDLFGRRIPFILPGGYLVGTLLLINLLAAHTYRFQLSIKKLGILIAHAGVILILIGQLVTDMFAHESQVSFAEGQGRRYSESVNQYELAFMSGNGTNGARTVAFPAQWLTRDGDIQNTNLPFTIRVKQYWKNSDPQYRAPVTRNNSPSLTTNGLALAFDFAPTGEVKTMDDKNAPTAIIEIITPNGSLGSWVVSDWADDDAKIEEMRGDFVGVGQGMADKIIAELTQPQFIIVNGTKYTFELRPERTYFPFSLTLLKATHTIYEGTDIPKDFRSRVQLQNPQTAENREVEISMNHPLRYAGLTFYQQQMNASEASQQAGLAPWSLLQVVHNPGWLTPYLGCALVAAGLVIQFMFHLVGFIKRK